ncbi:hypothetical protein GIB67_019722 [Kingdonia uniflora]|uniref:O-fucosyltransferase family protein n=1 Tax=Kingdonia uniflora TaxID=39325 RepID=A0A7J7MJY8_9MAGN|nr:hypothetical protein GIB67_019722 [Kingdonia uniflora]
MRFSLFGSDEDVSSDFVVAYVKDYVIFIFRTQLIDELESILMGVARRVFWIYIQFVEVCVLCLELSTSRWMGSYLVLAHMVDNLYNNFGGSSVCNIMCILWDYFRTLITSYSSDVSNNSGSYLRYEILIENLMDPAHVPYAHYGILSVPSNKADREGGKPIEINVQKIDINGFSAKQDNGNNKFVPPCVFYYSPDKLVSAKQESSSKMQQKSLLMIFFCIPVSPGKSRIIFSFPRNFAVWVDHVVPRWMSHINSNLIIDSDLYLLHLEELKIADIGPFNWQKACFVPTKSDAIVVAFRNWIRKYAGGQIDWGSKFGRSLPLTPPKEVLMDRYWSHVVNCSSCRVAVKRLKVLEAALQVFSIVSIGVIATIKQGFTSSAAKNTVIVLAVLCFAVIAITYQPPDPWLQSSQALTRAFTRVENATFKTDESVVRTGEDLLLSPAMSPLISMSITEDGVEKSEEKFMNSTSFSDNCQEMGINCEDPRALIAIEKFNLKVFKSIVFVEYRTPVNGSKPGECDVAWRFRNKKEKSWRKYRDFRRFSLGIGVNCTYEVTREGKWHSGTNAPLRLANTTSTKSTRVSGKVSPSIRDDEINDTIPIVGSEANFRRGRYLYYSRGGDYCKGMNQYLWSLLCGLGEAKYLNRTFVMDLNICLSGSYTKNNKDEEGKDFRYYFDFEHLKEVASIVEEDEFIKDWKKWDKTHRRKIPVRKVASYKVTPMQLRRDKSASILWRQFDAPEPENYWYRVCEGQAAKYIQRPWHAVWKSKRLMNIVSEISGQMDWDFDAVHVVRGEKAQNKELWPHLDGDTSPDSLLTKVTAMIQPWRNLYIATNEQFYNYFDKLRSQFKVHLLDDYKGLWGSTSEWYNETTLLNKGNPVDFDGYMRVAVDTEVLYRAKTRVETFYNLTSDCKDGVNTC